ncbi:hypothetical protein PF005_g28121 [Phytophthora fragariae]|uniref:Uncharacterized protein n=1 Tax=Phytophthora fragariae TaxID=53985 RepID=A0A6A3WCI2_9STRA|nr:hypothetical protein PF007_g27950 [Phytophthora fragariae]KAE9078587.1 hypothetical protein PF006_g27689 [Phytophthora fragariae]KAE9169060.1 hypothetical protein PF005_g28121 [Phytophthora fragariae]KAE9182829.1 hypothetical protein PF002_g26883 [Phytophthora fragariae]KAE9272975.1 hypothetical protein PF001_g27713 [Phytophthora fragariae]
MHRRRRWQLVHCTCTVAFHTFGQDVHVDDRGHKSCCSNTSRCDGPTGHSLRNTRSDPG